MPHSTFRSKTPTVVWSTRRVGRGFDGRVRELVEGDAGLAALVAPLLRVHGQLAAEALAYERRLVDEARHDPICRRLTSVPGALPITALAFTSTVDDLGRFRDLGQVSAWLVRNSGDTIRNSPAIQTVRAG